MSDSNRNEYLDQVVAQQERLEQDLRSKRSAPRRPRRAAPAAGRGRQRALAPAGGARRPAPTAVEVRVTGFWRWKTVLVPPNAFVVHTRRGHAEPLHVGLGTSFRFDPARDSYLVVPGAMQTILINAFCICQELQGSGRPGLRAVDHPGLRHRLPQAGLRRRRGPDAPGEPAAQGAGRGGDQGQGRHHERARGAQRQAAHRRGAHRPAARAWPRARAAATAAWGCASSPCRSRRRWSARRGSGRTCRSRSGPSRAASPGWPSWAPRRPSPSASWRRPGSQETQRLETERELADLRARNDAADVRPGGAGEGAPGRAGAGGRAAPGRAAERDHPARAGPGAGARRRGARGRPAAAGAGVRADAARPRRRAGAGPGPAPSRHHAPALLELERDRIRAGDRQRAVARRASRPSWSTRCPRSWRSCPSRPSCARSRSAADSTTVAGLLAELTAVVGALRSVVPTRTADR